MKSIQKQTKLTAFITRFRKEGFLRARCKYY